MLRRSIFLFKGQEYRPIILLRRILRDAEPGRNALTFDEEFPMRLSATPAPEPPRPLAAPRLADRLLALARSWLTRRAVLAELHGLDDRTLADLRIYPGDFQAIADGTYA